MYVMDFYVIVIFAQHSTEHTNNSNDFTSIYITNFVSMLI